MLDDMLNALLALIAVTLIGIVGVAVGAAVSIPIIAFGAGVLMLAGAAGVVIAGITTAVGR